MSIKVSDRRTGVLAAIWVGFAFLQIALALYLHVRDYIGPDFFKKFLAVINNAYAPYVGAIFTYFLVSNKKSKRQGVNRRGPFILALACSIGWNLAVLAFTAPLVFQSDPNVDSAINAITVIGSVLSWIPAPAIGFYFAKSGD
jgi:NhaP-type Na+/H+ or K+/H+ antiporter